MPLSLAVGPYGGGRCEWGRPEHPEVWSSAIEAAVAEQSGSLAEIWGGRKALSGSDWLDNRLVRVIESVLRSTLSQLYPESKVFATQAGPPRFAPDHG